MDRYDPAEEEEEEEDDDEEEDEGEGEDEVDPEVDVEEDVDELFDEDDEEVLVSLLVPEELESPPLSPLETPEAPLSCFPPAEALGLDKFGSFNLFE